MVDHPIAVSLGRIGDWQHNDLGLIVGSVEIIAKIPACKGLSGVVPVPGVMAFVVGFVLYIVLAKMGLESEQLEMPTPKADEPAAE